MSVSRSHRANFTNYPYIILKSKPFVANFPFFPILKNDRDFHPKSPPEVGFTL